MFPGYLCDWIVLDLENCGAKEKGSAICGRHDKPERGVTLSNLSPLEICLIPHCFCLLDLQERILWPPGVSHCTVDNLCLGRRPSYLA